MGKGGMWGQYHDFDRGEGFEMKGYSPHPNLLISFPGTFVPRFKGGDVGLRTAALGPGAEMQEMWAVSTCQPRNRASTLVLRLGPSPSPSGFFAAAGGWGWLLALPGVLASLGAGGPSGRPGVRWPLW